ncbi:unnamed protein product [Protopolystoma xenopodis]|uniref:Uncharacterized protein n=1 Tax=Protopolystoma xenopodis TaxID=117903 RepID=A0A448WNZ4_9PLAT|nr:unnamed protein product [Protopolystoma xenopodis]
MATAIALLDILFILAFVPESLSERWRHSLPSSCPTAVYLTHKESHSSSPRVSASLTPGQGAPPPYHPSASYSHSSSSVSSAALVSPASAHGDEPDFLAKMPSVVTDAAIPISDSTANKCDVVDVLQILDRPDTTDYKSLLDAKIGPAGS